MDDPLDEVASKLGIGSASPSDDPLDHVASKLGTDPTAKDLASDPTFDEVSYASQFPPGQEPQIAKDVHAIRAQAPGPDALGWALHAGTAAIKGGYEFAKDAPLSVGQNIVNGAMALSGDRKAQTRAMVSAQMTGTGMAGMWDRLAGEGTSIGNAMRAGVTGAIGAPQSSAPSAPPVDKRAQIDAEFQRRVDEARRMQSLQSGQVQDTGGIASLYRGVSGQQPSMDFQSPADMDAAGTPWVPEDAAISQNMGVAANPASLVPLNLPGGALATKAAGAALEGVGTVASTLAKPALKFVPLGLKGAVSDAAGGFLKEVGNEARTGVPSATTKALGESDLTGQINLAAEMKSRLGKSMVGAIATPLQAAPLNLLLSKGDPDQFGQLEGQAGALGGMAGAGNFAFRPDILNRADAALQARGAQPTGNKPMDALNAKGAALLLPEDAARVNALRGVFRDMPVDTGTGKKVGANIYTLTPEDFAAQLQARGVSGHEAELAQQQGYYDGQSGEALINAGQGSPGYTGAHESGHIGEQVLELMGQNGNPLHQAMMDSLQSGLIEGGQPTRLFRRFIDGYKQGATPEIQSLPDSNPYWQREFLADTVSKIIAKNGVAEYAVPKALSDRVLSNVGKMWGKLTGTEGQFSPHDPDSVRAINEAGTNMLRTLAGTKFRGSFGDLQPGPAAPTPQAPTPPIQAPPELVTGAARTIPAPKGLGEAKSPPIQGPRSLLDALSAPVSPSQEMVDAMKGGAAPQSAPKPASQPAPAPQLPADSAPAVIPSPAQANPIKSAPKKTVSAPPNSDDVVKAMRALGVKAGDPKYESVQKRIEEQLSQDALKKAMPPAPAQLAPSTSDSSNEPIPFGELHTWQQTEAPKTPADQVKEIAAQLPKDGDGLKVVQNPYDPSRASVKGDIDPQNPVHQQILAVSGIDKNPEALDALHKLQAAKGGVQYVTYRSAKDLGGEHSGTKRGTDYDASTAQERLAGTGEETKQTDKAFIPLGSGVTKDGRVISTGYSPDKLMSNVAAISKAAVKAGLPAAFDPADLQAAIVNQAHGYKGDGSGPFVSSVTPKVDPSLTPTVIPPERYQVINMAIHESGAMKLSSRNVATRAKASEAQGLAKVNAPYKSIPVSSLPEDIRSILSEFMTSVPETLPVEKIPLSRIPEVPLDPYDRGEQYASEMSGNELPPILVSGDDFIDGKHRVFQARKEGAQTIDAIDISKAGNPSDLAARNSMGKMRASGDPNPLRDALKKAGFDAEKQLESPFETLYPELITNVSDQPGEKYVVRPMWKGNMEPTFSEGIPNSTMARAGFLPKPGSGTLFHGGDGDPGNFEGWASRGGLGPAYFTDSKKVAWRYALGGGIDDDLSLSQYRRKQLDEIPDRDPKVTSVNLDVKNPLDISRISWDDISHNVPSEKLVKAVSDFSYPTIEKWEQLFSESGEPGKFSDWVKSNFDKLAPDLEGYFNSEDNAAMGRAEPAKFLLGTNLLHDMASRMGHDGFVMDDAEAGGRTWVPMDRSQISRSTVQAAMNKSGFQSASAPKGIEQALTRAQAERAMRAGMDQRKRR